MTPSFQSIFNEFIQRWPPPGPRVLELGASVESARGFQRVFGKEAYVGLDLTVTSEGRGLGITEGNANSMPHFADNSFDAVVASSMFEHDPQFWLTREEVRRVLVPGGRFYVGVPGFGAMGKASRLARVFRNRLDHVGMHGTAKAVSRAIATGTYPLHLEPNDYFRFSMTGVTDVLLDRFRVLSVQEVLSPPRFQAVAEPVG